MKHKAINFCPRGTPTIPSIATDYFATAAAPAACTSIDHSQFADHGAWTEYGQDAFVAIRALTLALSIPAEMGRRSYDTQ
jgi:hypothetical protein